MTEGGGQQKVEALNRALACLREFFDSAQIVVTNDEPRGTLFFAGFGNQHARFGSVYDWLELEKAWMRRQAEAHHEAEEEGEDEA